MGTSEPYASGDTRRRWSAVSADGGETWGCPHEVADLPDGPQGNNFGLFGGLTRCNTPPDLALDVLLFSNCDHYEQRRNGAVWLSVDGGVRWPLKRALAAGEFGYSSLAAGRAGTASE